MEPQFRILGPLEVAIADRAVQVGGPRPRRLLARLLLQVGEVVSVDRLIAAVWEHDPPAGAEATLRTHVANLRRSLVAAGFDEVLVTRSPGYRLQVAPEHLDATRFERLVAQGRAALDRADAEAAAQQLRDALGLWRGAVLEDLDAPQFAQATAVQLEELRLTALESRIDADLALGCHRELIAELETLVDRHPFREHLWSRLMLALYRSGRQVDALEAFRTLQARLNEELGLTPGQTLTDLQAAILRHDPELALPAGHDRTPATRGGRPPHGRDPVPPDALLDVVRRVPMVGRAAELEQLRRTWQAVRDGARRIALISGEAGVGKTRLVADLAAGAAPAASVLVGRCEQAALIPYQPVTDALRRSPDADSALADLPGAVQDRLAPLLRGRTDERATDTTPAEDPEAQRFALLDAVGQLVARMASSVPVILVIEEAECIDQASSRFLRHLARDLPERVLLLVCFRDPPGNRHPPLLEMLAELEGRGVADRLVLHPLPEHDLAELVAAWTGQRPPPDVVHTLWSSTGGNPFYASEVVRELLDRGGIDHADRAQRVPRTVQDVLRGRMRALSTAAQQVIGSIAVLGRDAELALLTEVAQLPADEVAEALEEATHAGWLVETGSSWEASHTFRHPLMRQAVHTDLPAPKRQRLHLRAADALESSGLHRPADVAAAAAHLRSAGSLVDRERTAGLSLRAADAAAELYAWDEAVGHAEAAVAILEHAGAPDGKRGDAAVRAAELYRKSSVDYRRALEHLDAALGHYQAAADRRAVAAVRSRQGHLLSVHHSVMNIPRALEHFAAAESALTDGVAAFDLHFGKALAALFGLQTDEGRAASNRAVDFAEGMGRCDLVAMVRATQASHWFHHGDLAAAHSLIDEAWVFAKELRDPHLGWETVTAPALVNNVYLLDPATSETWARRALAQPGFDTIARAREGVADQLTYALAIMGRLDDARAVTGRLAEDAVSRRQLLLDGDWEAVETSWATALDHDLGNGDLFNAGLNAYWLGRVRWLLGGEAGALAALERGLDISVGGPQVPAELMIRAELARLHAAAGNIDCADEHLLRCDEILDGGEDWRGRHGHVDLARGAVAAAHGELAVAHDAHRCALETFASYQLPWWRAEALLWSARWLQAADRRDDAEVHWRMALQLYEELGAHPRWRRRVAAVVE